MFSVQPYQDAPDLCGPTFKVHEQIEIWPSLQVPRGQTGLQVWGDGLSSELRLRHWSLASEEAEESLCRPSAVDLGRGARETGKGLALFSHAQSRVGGRWWEASALKGSPAGGGDPDQVSLELWD